MLWIGWLIVYSVGIMIFLILAKKRETNLFEDLDEKTYPLKRFLILGHYILNCFNYQYSTAYDQKLMLTFSQLYGTKEGKRFVKVHWANQITLLLVVIFIISFFAVALGDVTIEFFVIAVGMMVAVIYGLNHEVYQQLNKRKLQIKLDFTEFLSKLILLMSAGLTVSKAWEKIVGESDGNRVLHQELKITLLEIKNGKSEEEAYEDFANRCRNPEIFKFVSLIIQNLKKGNEETIIMLRMLTNECWIMRKNTAKVLGEEASTKLLLPMMIMFLAILLIVMTPAVLILMEM
ncbi:type II secretion system F family protein [Alkaliphilus transvaalensis]|uniref:type II secretion system F family protein n=1 Tax=Alkaliphilus transvaalensis TaxID=114628 RepID=UPI00047D052A|nr:type II secretion system F family protein [Alkaliphilus transvaalensis]